MQEGVVGTQSSLEGRYFTDFPDNDGLWQEQLRLPNAAINFGLADVGASDGRVVELRLPGHPEYAPTDNVGPSFATQIGTGETFHFGTFRTRVQFGSCAPTEEVIGAFFGFFNDGTDANENGIVDDQEINFQITCGAPTLAHLTVFTDFEAGDAGAIFRKLTRVINLESGEYYDTPDASANALVLTGSDPQFLEPGAFDSDAYYELGFEWRSDRIRFFMVLGGTEVTLWTLSEQARIPQRPLFVMYNLWHPDAHWHPATGEADYPASDVVLRADWFEHLPE